MNLNQITMSSVNIERSKQFYLLMGFILIVDTPHYLRFECPVGEATFSLSLTENVKPQNGTTVYFEFAEGELDSKVKQLEKAGFDILVQPHDARYLWRVAYLLDPSGNKLCLYHAGENRKNPPWRVN